MTEVRPFDGESVESMLKRFMKKVTASGIIQEVRARGEYVKPSEVIRKEKATAKSRIRRTKRKENAQAKFENENKIRPPRKPPVRKEEPKAPPPKPAPVVKKEEPKPSQESLKSLQEKFSK